MRRASATFTVRFLLRLGSMSRSISVKFSMPSGVPCGVMTSSIGALGCVTSTSTSRCSSWPSRSSWRSLSRVRRWRSRAASASRSCATSPVGDTTKMFAEPLSDPDIGTSAADRLGGVGLHVGHREEQVEQALFDTFLSEVLNFRLALRADHVDGALHEVTHHRLPRRARRTPLR